MIAFGGRSSAAWSLSAAHLRSLSRSASTRRYGSLAHAPASARRLFAPHTLAPASKGRVFHQYALHRASADAQRLADLQYARAAFVEAQDALFSFSLRGARHVAGPLGRAA
jgi:hypothetical protein